MMIIICITMLYLFLDQEALLSTSQSALSLWYQSLIPALLPMMFFSSVLVDTKFALTIGKLIHLVLGPIFRISKVGSYSILAGFLFGFPMGAKTVCDLVNKGMMDPKEGEFLLSFNNHLGPMYLCHIICPLFGYPFQFSLWFSIYGISLVYGIVLRYTQYRKENFPEMESKEVGLGFVDALYESIPKSVQAILLLGGTMFLFQLFYITIAHLEGFLNRKLLLLYPLVEITGGLVKLAKETPIPLVVSLFTLGGISCFMQTYIFIKKTPISMKQYCIHKLCLTGVVFIYAFIVLHN